MAITLLYMSINTFGSMMVNNGKRSIDSALVTAKIEELNEQLAELDTYDTSEYSADELTDYNNRKENYRRSILTLEEALKGNYDGKKYAVTFVDTSDTVMTFGTHSYSYDTVFRTFVLDFLIMLIAIFSSITVANVFGAEYSEKTVKLMFTKPASRIKLFLCKIAVALKETILYVIIGFAVLLFVCWADTGLDFKPMLCYIGNGVRIVGVFEQLLICFTDLLMASLFYTTLAVFFSVATKSRVLPIFGVILFSRLPDLEAIKSLLRGAATSSVGTYNALYLTNIDLSKYISFTQLYVNGTNFTISFFVLLIYTVLLFVASLLAFKRQRVMK